MAATNFPAAIDRSAGPDACWPWTGALDQAGYPSSNRKGRAHLRAYALARGPVPPGLVLHHTCMNRACCNPRHLVVMERGEHVRLHRLRENAERRQAGRCSRGHEWDGKGRCPACNREAQKRWRDAHPELHRQRTEAWRKAHLPEVRERQRKYRASRAIVG